MLTVLWILLASVVALFVLVRLGGAKWTTRTLLFAYNTSKKKGLSEMECLFEMFIKRMPWKALPPAFLRGLSARLGSKEAVVKFIILCERTGIFRKNIRFLTGHSLDDNPDFALDGVAIPLIHHANAMGNTDKLQQAQNALELALLLNPWAPTAWASMALVRYKLGDYKTAAQWAAKVLSYKPDPCSDDLRETGVDEFQGFGVDDKVAKMLGEPGTKNSWGQLKQQMRAIMALSDRT